MSNFYSDDPLDPRSRGKRLEEIHKRLDAVGKEDLIFVVESERDVEALESWRCCAVAHSWLEQTEIDIFRGKDVVHIGIHTPAGRAYALRLMRALAGVVHEQGLVELPTPGGRAADWRAAGHTGKELSHLVHDAPALDRAGIDALEKQGTAEPRREAEAPPAEVPPGEPPKAEPLKAKPAPGERDDGGRNGSGSAPGDHEGKPERRDARRGEGKGNSMMSAPRPTQPKATARKPQSAGPTPEFARLPAALESEKLILGAVLRNQQADINNENSPPVFESLRNELRADEFHGQLHRIAWSALDDLWARGFGEFDYLALATELQKRGHREMSPSYWADLTEIPDIVNLPFHVANVKMAALRNRAIKKAHEMTTRLLRDDEDHPLVIASGAEFYRELQSEFDPHQDAAPSLPCWPDPLREPAYHGVAGELVRLIEPHTEADPAALLLQFLVAFGSLIGRGPYMLGDGARHHTNESAVMVGATAKGRKGTSWARIEPFLSAIDEYWADNRLLYGIGSGEALVEKAAEEDHRVLLLESEFARLLATVNREKSTISANIRTGWDTGILEIYTRQSKKKTKDAHLSMIGHITRDELLRRLSDTEVANGFGNRNLFACVQRSKLLPHGGGLTGDTTAIISNLRQATDKARRLGNTQIEWDSEAYNLWTEKYSDLSKGVPGLLGTVTNRAEAHVLRLSLIYALLDRADAVSARHLRAALEVWRYCYDSARFIWGEALGDPTADSILAALRESQAGLTRWEIHNHFGRNKPANDIDRAMGVLTERGLIRCAKEESGGRPTTRYWAI